MEAFTATVSSYLKCFGPPTEGAPAPTLHYFALCGRGECARLICAAGELEFNDECFAPAFDESGGFRAGYAEIGEKLGLPGSLPILEHGDLKLFQTAAIESYLASIAPKFKGLTPAMRAKDFMFAQVKEDINAATGNMLFKKITAEELTPIAEKAFGVLESLLPDEGFVNALAFPTVADLAVLVIAQGVMPFQAALKMAGWDWAATGKYPKIARVAEAAAAYAPVAAFLEASEHGTLKADPFGIMAPPPEPKDE